MCFETTDFCAVDIVSFGGGLILQIVYWYMNIVKQAPSKHNG